MYTMYVLGEIQINRLRDAAERCEIDTPLVLDALDRLSVGRGSPPDLDTIRELAAYCSISLPEVRSLESVHAELRRNA